MFLHRPLRAAAVAVAAGLALTGGVTAAGPAGAATTPKIYAALGDSYSSGVGTGLPDPSVFDNSNPASCKQSSVAYGPLWAAAHSATYTLPQSQFLACSGAHLDDTENPFGTTGPVGYNVNTQLTKIDPNASLVSFTGGGNDAGFANVAASCLTTVSACNSAIAKAKSPANVTKLSALALKTVEDIHNRARSAKVAVVAIPHLYALKGNCVGGSETNRKSVNDTVDFGDDVLKQAVAKANANAGVTYAYFVDPRPYFDPSRTDSPTTGHGICADNAWIRGSTTADPLGAFHPTRDGHQFGFLPALTAAVG